MILRDLIAHHGEKNKKPFFEGWYHKLITVNGQSVAIIPGIYCNGLNYGFTGGRIS